MPKDIDYVGICILLAWVALFVVCYWKRNKL